MSQRVYKSNISPLWTSQRQDAVLPQGIQFEDQIKPHRRRRANLNDLPQRANLLRPTTRQGVKTIVVAALPVLAFDSDDFIYVLKQAADLTAEIHVCEPPMVFKPHKQAAILDKAAQLFRKAKDESNAFERGRLGGIQSAAKRKAEAEEKAQGIGQYWNNARYTNAELVKMSGVSINTLKRIFGSREKAIRNALATQKRKAARGAKR